MAGVGSCMMLYALALPQLEKYRKQWFPTAQELRQKSVRLHGMVWNPTNYDDVKRLITERADVHSMHAHTTPLMRAVTLGDANLPMVTLLLDHGADIEGKSSDKKTRPLMYVSTVSYKLNSIKLLLDRKADVNARDGDGMTALMHASTHNNTGGMQLLLDNKADIDARDVLGQSALIHAAKRGFLDACQQLLQAKADPFLIDNKSCSALSIVQKQWESDAHDLQEGRAPSHAWANLQQNGMRDHCPDLEKGIVENYQSTTMMLRDAQQKAYQELYDALKQVNILPSVLNGLAASYLIDPIARPAENKCD